jgi:hypothetical protein
METIPPSQPDLAVDVQHVTTTTTTISAPINTATPAIHETTTTTTMDSNSAITKIEQRYKEEPEVRREKEGKGVEKEDRVSKRENKRREANT